MTEKKKIGITDTSLRDAHQSLLATRMRLVEMLPILKFMDQIGYHSLEVWGGATFDTCMRFLDEDPWERLRQLRKGLPNTKLQMLLRGQNIVGYRHYPDDVLAEFVKKAVTNGIDIIRIFDALNDLRNMEQAIKYTKAEGAHAQGTISYTISPLHNNDHFVKMGSDLKNVGADSICIKDMAGLIAPYDAYELVSRLKQEVDLPVQLHCHYTSGMASMSYLKAVEAGVDVIDTANAALAMGTSQPATDSMVAALQGTPYDTGLDLEMLAIVSQHFKEISCDYEIPRDVLAVDTNVLSYQIPGGMISNLASQLVEQQATHLLKEVLAEVPKVRADLGYPPLVTPSSQIVGTQAVVNVLTGERYKMVSTEIKNYLRGLYGRPPGEINPDVLKKVLKDEQPISGRPADQLKPQLAEAKKEIAEYIEQEEDVLSYVIFPNVAIDFFKRRSGILPPLELKDSCDSGIVINAAKNQKSETKNPDLADLQVVDESLIGSDEINVIYPA
ncbi:MAG: oxaloacetate decarboxylase [Firmicutes bacterium ML8_F2]|jgi:oxaloacetate decarboxylase (Na+ extruding) subunit alpha|nr:MAG: oxaloacetate decarboxylase [Firmicutes bacterium ML8_F2]